MDLFSPTFHQQCSPSTANLHCKNAMTMLSSENTRQWKQDGIKNSGVLDGWKQGFTKMVCCTLLTPKTVFHLQGLVKCLYQNRKITEFSDYQENMEADSLKLAQKWRQYSSQRSCQATDKTNKQITYSSSPSGQEDKASGTPQRTGYCLVRVIDLSKWRNPAT